MGKKAKKKAEPASDGEAPLPVPEEGAEAQADGEPQLAQGAADAPPLSAALLPLPTLSAADLGAFFPSWVQSNRRRL